jgi:ribosomal protein L37AE/L43A
MILKCNECKPHPYQDQKYGEKMRVHNPKVSKNGIQQATCTVCGRVRDAREG